VVRLARHEHGTGLASGWLVEHAALGTSIDLRLRANPGFRADDETDAAPAIFIGNGTGIAGLRSHLQARIGNGQHANWLIFGERERARDFYFADEINAWETEGALARLDLAFSRDADNGRYVQTALAEQAERLREWVAAGATIFVCGSHDGMAPGVTGTLVGILGATTVEAMNDAQRIRMDVY
jgi:sulfite reductase (NADPH) flavoprotein alpha-component